MKQIGILFLLIALMLGCTNKSPSDSPPVAAKPEIPPKESSGTGDPSPVYPPTVSLPEGDRPSPHPAESPTVPLDNAPLLCDTGVVAFLKDSDQNDILVDHFGWQDIRLATVREMTALLCSSDVQRRQQGTQAFEKHLPLIPAVYRAVAQVLKNERDAQVWNAAANALYEFARRTSIERVHDLRYFNQHIQPILSDKQVQLLLAQALFQNQNLFPSSGAGLSDAASHRYHLSFFLVTSGQYRLLTYFEVNQLLKKNLRSERAFWKDSLCDALEYSGVTQPC